MPQPQTTTLINDDLGSNDDFFCKVEGIPGKLNSVVGSFDDTHALIGFDRLEIRSPIPVTRQKQSVCT